MAGEAWVCAQKFQDVHLIIGSFVNALLDQNLGQLVIVLLAFLVALIEHPEAKRTLWELEPTQIDLKQFLQSQTIGGGAAVDLDPVHQALVVGFIDVLPVI